jgi:hypothetical protein
LRKSSYSFLKYSSFNLFSINNKFKKIHPFIE